MILTAKTLETAIISKIIHDKEAREEIISLVSTKFFKIPSLKKIYEEHFIEENFNSIEVNLHKSGLSSDSIEKLMSETIDQPVEDILELYRSVYSNRIIDEKLSNAKSETDHLKKASILESVQEEIEGIDNSGSTITSPIAAIALYREQLHTNQERVRENPTGVSGMSSGLEKLDEFIQGIGHQDYVLLAARPSMGKTSAVIKMFLSALYEDKVAVFISLETPIQDLIARIITQIDSNLKLKETLYGHNYEDVNPDIEEVLQMLEQKKMYIIDLHEDRESDALRPTPSFIAKKLRKIEKIEGEIGLVVWDHIGLMSGSKHGLREGNETVTAISRELKLLIKRFQCPFIVLSQLNRELEKRIDKRPKLSDLRDSGALEQDADKIIFVYRSFIYQAAEYKEQMKQKPEDRSIQEAYDLLMEQDFDAAEFIIGKNRNGPLGTVDLLFIRKNASFTDEVEEIDLDGIYGNTDVYNQSE